MTEKQTDQSQQAGRQKAPAPGNAAGNPAAEGTPPPPPPAPSDQPVRAPRRVEVTGKMPDDIRIDPDITEGHPGYEESGDSEIIPPNRLAGKQTAGEGDQAG